MAEMTPKERLLTAIRRGVPDRVPVAPDLARWSRNRNCSCIRHLLAVNEEFGFDPLIPLYQYTSASISNDYIYSPGGGFNYSAQGLYGDLPDVDVEIRVENKTNHVWFDRRFKTPAGELHDIIQWARPGAGYGDGPNPHRVEPLVKSLDDVEALRYLFAKPRKDLTADIPLILKEYGGRALFVASDGVHMGSWGAEALGPENMLVASVEAPELLEAVCQATNKVHLENLRVFFENGVEAVMDSWFQCGLSTGWSPKTFEKVFLPLIKECIDLAHHYNAAYLYYDAGKIRDITPWIVDAGADVLCGLQPPGAGGGDMSLGELKKGYGDRIALMGGLDPCYAFDMGTPDTVRNAARNAIEDAACNGGFILGTAMSVSPSVPTELLQTLASTAREYGQYQLINKEDAPWTK